MCDSLQKIIKDKKISFNKVWKYVMRDFREKGEMLPNKKIFKNYYYNIIPNLEPLKNSFMFTVFCVKEDDDIDPGKRKHKIDSHVIGIDSDFYLKRMIGGKEALAELIELYGSIDICPFVNFQFTLQELMTCSFFWRNLSIEEAIAFAIQESIYLKLKIREAR